MSIRAIIRILKLGAWYFIFVNSSLFVTFPQKMGSRIESSLTRDLMRMHFKWKRTKKSIFQKRYNAAASVTSELLVQLTNFFFLSEQFSAQRIKVPKDKKILNRFLERKAKCNHTSLYFFLPEIGFLGFHYYHKIIICAFKKAIFTENDFIFHIKKWF